MKVMILCAGKMKEKAYRQMADEYLKRLSRYGKYEEIEVPDLPENTGSDALEERVRIREGEAMLARIHAEDRVIALTIPGGKLDSPGVARRLEAFRSQGIGRVVFLIGGSLGLGRNVLSRADEEWSMSDLTFPHQLARVMLLEQLYRAEKIAAGERYHK